MTSRQTGWLLLLLAVVAVLAVAAIGRVHGGVDGLLAVIVAGALLAALLVVGADARRARRSGRTTDTPSAAGYRRRG